MLTVTLKNTEQNYLAKLTLENKAYKFDLQNSKKLSNESRFVLKPPVRTHKNAEVNIQATIKDIKKDKSSNWILATVILMHLLVISAFYRSNVDQIKVIENKPMTVSLLRETPKNIETAIQKQMPAEQIQTNEKQIKSPEQLQMKAETQHKIIKAETEVASQPYAQETESKEINNESTGNLAKVVHEEKVVSHEKVAEEHATEQPKFDVAYLNNPAPVYPKMSRRQGEQGRVLLKVLVSENGIAEQVQLDTSSGYEKLDQAAIEAVKKWSFVPAKKSDQAVSAFVLVPVKFELNS